jgi:hypothetical protein
MPKAATTEDEVKTEISLGDETETSSETLPIKQKKKYKNKQPPIKQGVRRFVGVRLTAKKICTHDRRTGLKIEQSDLIAAETVARDLEREWQRLQAECSKLSDQLEREFEEKVARLFQAPFAK